MAAAEREARACFQWKIPLPIGIYALNRGGRRPAAVIVDTRGRAPRIAGQAVPPSDFRRSVDFLCGRIGFDQAENAEKRRIGAFGPDRALYLV